MKTNLAECERIKNGNFGADVLCWNKDYTDKVVIHLPMSDGDLVKALSKFDVVKIGGVDERENNPLYIHIDPLDNIYSLNILLRVLNDETPERKLVFTAFCCSELPNLYEAYDMLNCIYKYSYSDKELPELMKVYFMDDILAYNDDYFKNMYMEYIDFEAVAADFRENNYVFESKYGLVYASKYGLVYASMKGE